MAPPVARPSNTSLSLSLSHCLSLSRSLYYFDIFVHNSCNVRNNEYVFASSATSASSKLGGADLRPETASWRPGTSGSQSVISLFFALCAYSCSIRYQLY